jgi:hypothetical protein
MSWDDPLFEGRDSVNNQKMLAFIIDILKTISCKKNASDVVTVDWLCHRCFWLLDFGEEWTTKFEVSLQKLLRKYSKNLIYQIDQNQ